MQNIFEPIEDENEVEDFLVGSDPGDEQVVITLIED